MSINEADLPAGSRRFAVTTEFPNSHVTTARSGQVEFVTGPKGDQGIPGPPGPQGQWDAMTQAEFDALPVKDPETFVRDSALRRQLMPKAAPDVFIDGALNKIKTNAPASS